MPEPHLVPTPVGKAVGSVRHNGPEHIEPVEPSIVFVLFVVAIVFMATRDGV